MTNMVLPSGEIPSSTVNPNTYAGIDNTVKDIDNDNIQFSTTLYDNDNKIKLNLDSASLGENKIYLNCYGL